MTRPSKTPISRLIARKRAADRARELKRRRELRDHAITVAVSAIATFATFFVSYGFAQWVVGL